MEKKTDLMVVNVKSKSILPNAQISSYQFRNVSSNGSSSKKHIFHVNPTYKF